jgi:hypothetical protein
VFKAFCWKRQKSLQKLGIGEGFHAGDHARAGGRELSTHSVGSPYKAGRTVIVVQEGLVLRCGEREREGERENENLERTPPSHPGRERLPVFGRLGAGAPSTVFSRK